MNVSDLLYVNKAFLARKTANNAMLSIQKKATLMYLGVCLTSPRTYDKGTSYTWVEFLSRGEKFVCRLDWLQMHTSLIDLSVDTNVPVLDVYFNPRLHRNLKKV